MERKKAGYGKIAAGIILEIRRNCVGRTGSDQLFNPRRVFWVLGLPIYFLIKIQV
jgi:hypothetical protein